MFSLLWERIPQLLVSQCTTLIHALIEEEVTNCRIVGKKQQPLMEKERQGERGKREKSKEKRKGVRSGQNNSKSIKMKSHLE